MRGLIFALCVALAVAAPKGPKGDKGPRRVEVQCTEDSTVNLTPPGPDFECWNAEQFVGFAEHVHEKMQGCDMENIVDVVEHSMHKFYEHCVEGQHDECFMTAQMAVFNCANENGLLESIGTDTCPATLEATEKCIIDAAIESDGFGCAPEVKAFMVDVHKMINEAIGSPQERRELQCEFMDLMEVGENRGLPCGMQVNENGVDVPCTGDSRVSFQAPEEEPECWDAEGHIEMIAEFHEKMDGCDLDNVKCLVEAAMNYFYEMCIEGQHDECFGAIFETMHQCAKENDLKAAVGTDECVSALDSTEECFMSAAVESQGFGCADEIIAYGKDMREAMNELAGGAQERRAMACEMMEFYKEERDVSGSFESYEK